MQPISSLSSPARRAVARRICVVAVAGAATAALAGAGAGAAQAALGDNLPDTCTQYSQDGGSTWGGPDRITWKNAQPVPGGDVSHASFQVKNTCDKPAKVQVYAGNWSVTGNGSATVRANAAGVNGTSKALSGVPGILVVESGRIAKDTPVQVDLFIGIPAGETHQGFVIKPDWSISLEEVAGGTPTDPTDPGDGGGSLGDAFGSLGGSGSLGGIFAAQPLRAPAVHLAHR